MVGWNSTPNLNDTTGLPTKLPHGWRVTFPEAEALLTERVNGPFASAHFVVAFLFGCEAGSR